MEDNDIASNAFGVPPFLYMTLEMDESVMGVRVLPEVPLVWC